MFDNADHHGKCIHYAVPLSKSNLLTGILCVILFSGLAHCVFIEKLFFYLCLYTTSCAFCVEH